MTDSGLVTFTTLSEIFIVCDSRNQQNCVRVVCLTTSIKILKTALELYVG